MSDQTCVPGQQAWMNVTLRVSVKVLCRSAPGTEPKSTGCSLKTGIPDDPEGQGIVAADHDVWEERKGG